MSQPRSSSRGLPDRWDLNNLVLPEIRRAIQDSPAESQDALFLLLALVDDLATEVDRLRQNQH